MDEFLTKPIRPADLLAAIDRVLGAHSPPKTRSLDLLDAPVLLAACGDDDATLEKISQVLRARLPDHLMAVQDALREQNSVRLREAAHNLCGSVTAFSTVVGTVASDLEDRAARGQLEEAGPLVQQLEAMARELLELAGGLSLKALRQHAETSPDSRPAEQPSKGQTGDH